MPHVWNSDLETGLKWQDDEHKELFQRLADLMDAAARSQGTVELLRYLLFLEDYVTTHMGREEQEMVRTSYPEQDKHTAEHLIFSRQIESLRSKVEGGVEVRHVTEALHRSYEWLRTHIAKTDRHLGIYLLANK